jgi:hypothetical protein
MAKDIRGNFLDNPCCVLGYPEPWDSAGVAVILAQRVKFDLQRAIVITWNPVLASNILTKSNFSNHNIVIWEYNVANKLLDLRNSLIIFDSLLELDSLSGIDSAGEVKIGMEILPHLIKNRNIVLILFTTGILEENFAKLKTLVPGIYYFWTTFLERPHNLELALHESNMTSNQKIIYSSIRNAESEDDTYYESQKICNILLPKTIHELMETPDQPSVEEMMNMYTKTIPKLRQEYTRPSTVIRKSGASSIRTITQEEYTPKEFESVFSEDEFLRNAPKIKDLIAQLHLYSDMKHVVYTRYSDHYGVKMLKILLKYKGFKVFGITKDMELKTQLEILKSFNLESRTGILILSTHIAGVEGILNVSHLHFLDSGYEIYNILMEEIYKFRLYKSFICNLMVHNYVCDKDGPNPSADRVLYGIFIDYLNLTRETMKAEKSKCHPIVIGSIEGRLSPMTLSKK